MDQHEESLAGEQQPVSPAHPPDAGAAAASPESPAGEPEHPLESSGEHAGDDLDPGSDGADEPADAGQPEEIRAPNPMADLKSVTPVAREPEAPQGPLPRLSLFPWTG